MPDLVVGGQMYVIQNVGSTVNNTKNHAPKYGSTGSRRVVNDIIISATLYTYYLALIT